jgi:hypothetical protein
LKRKIEANRGRRRALPARLYLREKARLPSAQSTAVTPNAIMIHPNASILTTFLDFGRFCGALAERRLNASGRLR